jgi:hypothetical protein
MERSDQESGKTTNRLIHNKSPYLLQHAQNPVDWFPWGEEAFAKAKGEDKPIFLSIGYATCHWCHVMAHESFEDEGVARLLNQFFVSIKVDREERPDIDHIYMTVCQALTGRGGWPLSIFMTQDGKPFFSGTYFPKQSRTGMPGLTDILTQISNLWRTDRPRLLKAADEITRAIQPSADARAEDQIQGAATSQKAFENLARSFDTKWGGFGGAPKFPTPHQLTFLLRWHRRSGKSLALEMVEKTLQAMRRGGIFDHVGFGFHRYSVDERWLVPHFEKMLYDQALLAMAFTEAFLVTGNSQYAQTTREILAYVLRDMTSPEGAFYSAEDADSEGKEGLFYVWNPVQVKACLGERLGDLFCRFYGITEEGNFEEGLSIPHITADLDSFATIKGMQSVELVGSLRDARERLFLERQRRIHPLKDDKVITGWNGLMIAALSKAAQALGEPAYEEAARRAADFLLSRMKTASGRLMRRFRLEEVAFPGYLEDYAFLIWGLIDLYETTFRIQYLEEALSLSRTMMDLFWSERHGGFFFMGSDNEPLIAQAREAYDGAVPSGNSVAALNLLRLGRMTGDVHLEDRAHRTIQAFAAQIAAAPMAHTQFLNAVDFLLGPTQEIVLSGDPEGAAAKAMIRAVHGTFFPNRVLLLRADGSEGKRLFSVAPYTERLVPLGDQATAFLCQDFACKSPVTDVEELLSAMRQQDASVKAT